MNKSSDTREVTYIEYRDEFAKDFASINYAWLNEYFRIEPQDRKVLENPVKEVIEPGGQIFFALVDGKAVGTVALQVKDEDTFELVKMGVLSGYKGLKIGKGLMNAAINYGRKSGKKRIVLETNSKLAAALHIYRSAGFIEMAPDPNTKYTRCDLWMELRLR